MYLTADSIVPYLLQRGILATRDLVREKWYVATSDLKRPVLRVSTPAGFGWVVKQASPLDVTHVRMLDREAAYFQLPDVQAWARPLKQLMPKMRAYDPGVHTLIVEQLPHETAWDYLRREDARSAALGTLLGRALARSHLRIPSSMGQPLLFAANLPWVLQLNHARPNEIEEAATRALLAIFRSDEALTRRLIALEASWTPETLIHGDAKLDNVLVRMSAPQRVWLIDWAFAGVGDPAWDLGSMMQSCLSLWLYGIAFRRDEPFEEAVARAAFPIKLVRTFTRSLLKAYKVSRCLNEHTAGPLILRAVRCSGAALLQAALADSRSHEQYTTRQLIMLQFGARILAAPQEALLQLFDVR